MRGAAPREAAPIGPDAFASAFAGWADLGGPVLLAVSGGPDSTALMHAAARWSRTVGAPLPIVGTIDHGLRPGSRAEAEAVAAAAAAMGLDHHLLVWARQARSRAASQAEARRARYGLLNGLAAEVAAAAVATAHTRDDQAETLLMRMAAGSGPAGLAGMRRASRRNGLLLLRPCLGFAKADLTATCRAEGWAFVEDPSNADSRFARVRWRALAPALAAQGLDARRLGRLAERLARADDALEAAASAALAACLSAPGPVPVGAGLRLDFARLAREPEEVALRALARALPPASALRLERLEACFAALRGARAAGRALRRTLAGHLLTLDREGGLAVACEPPRSRGRVRPFTVTVAGAPHSLGMGGGHA